MLSQYEIDLLKIVISSSAKFRMEDLQTLRDRLGEDIFGIGAAIDKYMASSRAAMLIGGDVEFDNIRDALEKYLETLKNDKQIRLVVLMRNDMASLSSGRACAQATHAANQMVYELYLLENEDGFIEKDKLFVEWQSEACGFGTTIVLSVNEHQMRETIAAAKAAGFHAGIVNDPEYSLRDGDTIHLISVDTCAYIFARKGELMELTSGFSLMP